MLRFKSVYGSKRTCPRPLVQVVGFIEGVRWVPIPAETICGKYGHPFRVFDTCVAWFRQSTIYRQVSRLLWTLLALLVQRNRRRVHPAIDMRDKSQEPCCLPLKEEFQRSKFSLHHDDPGAFCRSQWQKGDRNLLWLLYRWILAGFFAGGVIGSMVDSFNGGRWFIYLTDWGFSLCFYCCAYGAIIATIYFIKPSYFAPGSWALKIYWISHYTTVVLALLITLVFWAALYPSMPGMGAELYNLWAHAFNSICMVFDCFMVAFPTRIMHFVYPFIAGITYGIFSLIYFWSGGLDPMGNRFIYFILDWERPGLAIGTVCGSVVLVSCFCVLVFGFYRLRISLYECCSKKPEEIPATSPPPKEPAPTV